MKPMPGSTLTDTPVLHLTVIDGSAVESFRVTGAITRIGRDATSDMVLRDKFISSNHAEIEMLEGRVRLRDMRSTNGTRVRRHRWVFPVDHASGHVAWLEDGDEILLGQIEQPVVIRLSLLRSSNQAKGQDDGATIVERVACNELPDVAERFDRNALKAVQVLSALLQPKDEPEVLVRTLAEGLLDQFPRATHVTVHLMDPVTGACVPNLALTRTGPAPPTPLSSTVREQVLERGEGISFVGEESESLQEASIRTGICAPLWTGDRVAGLVQVDVRGRLEGAFASKELRLLIVVAHQAALVLELSVIHASLRNRIERAVGGIVQVMESRDEYMMGHSQAVSELSRRIAQRLAIGNAEISVIARAAALHDLGRFAVPVEVLNKPDKLTDAEFRLVKAQPDLAVNLLERCEVLGELVPIVRHVHENWDGSGYPSGLAGNDIPLGARIVAVADAFHTLVSHRAHRQALAPQAALATMLSGAGKRFDARLLGVLEDVVGSAKDSWSDEPTVMGWEVDPSGKVGEP